MSIRWLVTGAGGMLGWEIVRELRTAGRDVTATGRDDLDITDSVAVRDVVPGYDVVVNAAAWTDVDRAEAHPDSAHQVNAIGPAHLADACAVAGTRLVQISTDYVFDGNRRSPYPENARTNPLNVYGHTKRDGEIAVRRRLPKASLIVRTSWLYGAHGTNFVATIAELASIRHYVDVVEDQCGQPTWTKDVAHRIVQLIDVGAAAGIYHATNSGYASWFDFAGAIFEELGHDSGRVRPTSAITFARAAPRPAYSVLADRAGPQAGLEPLRSWRAAFAAAAPEVLNHPTPST